MRSGRSDLDSKGRRSASRPVVVVGVAAGLLLGFEGGSSQPTQEPDGAAADFWWQGEPDARTLVSQGRPLDLEDHYLLRSVGSVGISPDGGWVSFQVSTPVEDTNDDRDAVWLVPSDGSASPDRVLHDGADVSDPGWLEDGRLRYRFEGEDWAVRPGAVGGEPERYDPPSGTLSPDGRWLARSGEVERSPRPEPEVSDFERRHEERFEGHAFDWYPYLRDGEAFPLPDPRAQPASEVFVEPVDGAEPPRQLTDLGLEAGGIRWAPDGSLLLFSVNEALLDEVEYGTSDLFLVTVEGELTRLTDDGYSYGGAEFSPNGDRIAYVRSYGTDMIIEQDLGHGGARDLFVRPLPDGDPVNLTAEWDLDAGSPRWSPDGRYLYFTAAIGGATHLFRVAADGTSGVDQVTEGERRIQNLEFDADLRKMAYTVGEFDRPPEVWAADVDGGNERRLSDVHREFLETVAVATHPSTAVMWESYDGTPIEGFLLFPHGYDPEGGPYPLIVVNHGGPHAASGYSFNFKNRLFTAHGYFVFLPNFRASTGYGTDFKWATWGGWGDKDGEDVLSGVDHLIESYPVDESRVGSTGHSYGGILTNWLITRYPDRFRAAVSGAGESNWTSNYAMSDVARTKDLEFFGPPWEPRSREIMIRQSPFLNCGDARTPTLFVHGEVDYRVPLSGATQLYTCFKRLEVPTKLIIYEGMAHSIQGHWNNVHRMMHELRWWETYLRPETLVGAEPGS